MILQSLISLYDRLHETERVPNPGFSEEDIGFVVNLDSQGRMVGQPEDLRTIQANVYDFKTSFVPYTNKVNVRANAAAKTPNFMVDKAGYIFGMSGKKPKKIHHKSFKELIDEVCNDNADEGVQAVQAFLKNWNPADAPKLDHWDEMSGPHGKWVAFRLKGDREFVHERPAVQKMWSDYFKGLEHPRGINLMDGETHDLQDQYAQFKFGSGASLVSFNENAYESYGKKRGENAPISVEAEFKSSTALKYLLRSRKQKLRIADATTVFWTERESPVEGLFGQVIAPALSTDTDNTPLREFLENVRRGAMPNDVDGAVRFYILGLSPNKARLALRFWYACSVEELMQRLHDHFANLYIERSSDKDIPFPGIWHLLKETARDTNDIKPLLGGAVTKAILTGRDYPYSLSQGVLGRIRADGRINYLRAAISKAVLRRNYNKEVPMSLDTERREPAYLLGRLFAVIEKAQLDALGRVNSTIKDRFFSAASATPASVFPRLLRMAQHYIDKAEYGRMSDRRIGEILENLDGLPAHMDIQSQGLFAIGYYHQKNDLWRKKTNEEEKGE